MSRTTLPSGESPLHDLEAQVQVWRRQSRLQCGPGALVAKDGRSTGILQNWGC